MWKYKGLRIAKVTLEKRNKVGELAVRDFSTYYKAVVIKMAWYWSKDRHKDQWNRIKSPEIDPHIYGQLIFDKDTKASL